MLKEISIKNFKSIAEDTIQLGRVNVFIGENGCGKSNILEAVGFASADKHDNEYLANLGIRVAKPSLIISNFKGNRQKKYFSIDIKFNEKENRSFSFYTENKENINETWNIEQMVSSNFFETIYDLISKNPNKFQEIANSMGEKQAKETEDLITMVNELKKVDYKTITELRQNSNLHLQNFLIYSINTLVLRGFTQESRKEPVGIYGENLDVLIANFDKEEQKQLKKYNYLIDWLDNYFVDVNDLMKLKGYKLNRSKSTLYFSDKFMSKKNNIFSSENANEGILHVLFYLAIMISKRTPKFFAIDNIESCLNPHLCQHLMVEMCKLAKENDKQMLITTHNPAILDGLNLFDDEIRLFEVKRLENGHSKTRRIKLKPEVQNEMGEKYKLSELWTRGFLGAISQNF
ncbi:MAG: recombinase RecF [Bacteroidetes bacterium]|nr:MAG: recombinase RecF [Bacteroidota bacterium]